LIAATGRNKMKDIYNKIADIIYTKDKKILYETAYDMAIDILKLPELKAIQVEAKVKPANGDTISTKEFIIKYFGLPEDVSFNKYQRLTYDEMVGLIESRLSV
jgi:hypothetical protein